MGSTGTPVRTLEEALERAYGQLGKRDRTVAELRANLQAADARPELIEKALAELKAHGYLDDERYARCFAEDRRRLDGWGSERIQRRLLELGVDAELAALACGSDRTQELSAAVELLRRRLCEPPTDPKAYQRALGLLLRRGYEQELAYEAVRAVAGE